MEVLLVAGTIMIMTNTMVLLMLAPTILKEVKHGATRKF